MIKYNQKEKEVNKVNQYFFLIREYETAGYMLEAENYREAKQKFFEYIDKTNFLEKHLGYHHHEKIDNNIYVNEFIPVDFKKVD